MSDPNGEEAGIKFLAENKTKDGVITLPSGLQYKVLSEGGGLEHPTVSTPCECHYKGRLLDGTEFDSSYKRGTPTTFAPNQVIKGWTEAMQLMVVGDKWEMYIPYELAYGKGGKPPKIPAAACLIFVMEIIKIKGDTVPKTIEFPEWTEEQLKLWLEKDEASCNSWRDAKIKSWEDGGKLKETYPTREELDAWVSKQCKGVKDKALWKRTHKKEATAEEQGPPKLTKESARKLLTEALATFKQPANKEKLEVILKECAEGEAAAGGEAGGMGGGMMKMMKLMPAVQEMMGATLQNYGFQASDTMTVVMQVQAFGAEDPSIAADVGKLMKAVQGDLTELLAE
eukprot:CAMPEP_0168408094 /NCGR_PEP_ID=MMETSP0228-20121227/26496_1 /TAXON_ID=133427 /ORGANISM="Protoceratium reticulatum, Strain CCCM 535 (=CCMP 1889)" /LENGTH=340 /DNA_ID=CAMNT_0008421775 /DNA_START=77 /DNA_END=1099 /DNA_ORIENTATION=+